MSIDYFVGLILGEQRTPERNIEINVLMIFGSLINCEIPCDRITKLN